MGRQGTLSVPTAEGRVVYFSPMPLNPNKYVQWLIFFHSTDLLYSQATRGIECSFLGHAGTQMNDHLFQTSNVLVGRRVVVEFYEVGRERERERVAIYKI